VALKVFSSILAQYINIIISARVSSVQFSGAAGLRQQITTACYLHTALAVLLATWQLKRRRGGRLLPA